MTKISKAEIDIAKELHYECHKAVLGCPQFRGYTGRKFEDLPEKGLYHVIKFWQDEHYLWEARYYTILPEHIQQIFWDIKEEMRKSVKRYAKKYAKDHTT